MANTENQCKDLVVIDYYSKKSHHLDVLLNHQKYMQETTYGYDYDKMTLADIMGFWHMNNHAMIDEIHEATDALGGIKDGDGSAIWKKWKSMHDKYKNMTIEDLSIGDLKELHMEIVDILHFFLNMAASVGLDAKTMFNYYFAKSDENKRRQEENY